MLVFLYFVGSEDCQKLSILVDIFSVIVVFFLFQSTVVKQQQQEPTHELQNSDVSTMHYNTVTGDMMTDIGNVYMFILLLKQEYL